MLSQSTLYLSMGVVLQLLSQKNQAMIGAEVVDLSAVREGEPRDVGVVHDGIFYNHYFRPSNCRNQSIAFFSANGVFSSYHRHIIQRGFYVVQVQRLIDSFNGLIVEVEKAREA